MVVVHCQEVKRHLEIESVQVEVQVQGGILAEQAESGQLFLVGRHIRREHSCLLEYLVDTHNLLLLIHLG